MSQISTPVGPTDVSVVGDWQPQPIWDKITPSGPVGVTSPTDDQGSYFIVNLGSLIPPQNGPQVLSVKLNTNGMSATIALLQANRQVASMTVPPATGFQVANMTLAPSQIAALGGIYTNLQLKVIAGSPSGFSLSFPGISNATIVNLGNVISPTVSIAISFWMKTTQLSLFPGLISKWANLVYSPAYYQYLLLVTSGKLFFETTPDGFTPGLVQSNSTVSDGDWHHIVAKCKAGTNGMQIWIDGKLDNQSNGVSGIQTSPDILVFGAWGMSNWDAPFDGEMTQILIADDLSSFQIGELYNGGVPPSTLPSDITGVLGYWPCSEGSGTTLVDHSGNGFDGVIASGVNWSTDYP